MNTTNLFYACMNAKFKGNYRTQKGATYASKLKQMDDQQLKKELYKLDPNHAYFKPTAPTISVV